MVPTVPVLKHEIEGRCAVKDSLRFDLDLVACTHNSQIEAEKIALVGVIWMNLPDCSRCETQPVLFFRLLFVRKEYFSIDLIP